MQEKTRFILYRKKVHFYLVVSLLMLIFILLVMEIETGEDETLGSSKGTWPSV
jgi:hypothetical protein